MNINPVVRIISGILSILVMVTVAHAQEGHPMSGVWVGDWTLNGAEQKRVVVVLDWIGTELSGTINPGPNAIAIKAATVNPDDWSVHLEADARNSQGQPVTYVIEGKLDDLGTYNRSLAGTWNVGDEPGTFSITRQ
jgi:hypothetical protein